MNDWGFDDIEKSTTPVKRKTVPQRCKKCQQMSVLETVTTRKTEDSTHRMKRCVSCGDEWWTKEVITTEIPYMDKDGND